jgi:hypothetical protein
MYPPVFTRVLKEDLGPTAPPWTDKITYQLNLMTDFLKTAFAKNISIQDNLLNPFKQVTLTAGATPASNSTSFSVPLPMNYQPKGVQIVNIIDNSGSVVGNATSCEMTPGLQNGNVVVRAIYGLTSGHTYTITFLVF